MKAKRAAVKKPAKKPPAKSKNCMGAPGVKNSNKGTGKNAKLYGKNGSQSLAGKLPLSTYTYFDKLRKSLSGRKSLLTAELIDHLAALLVKGHYLDTACDLLGLNVETIGGWLRRGQQEIINGDVYGPHAQFYRAVKFAQGASVDQCLAVINARATSWQAAAWLLERKFPDRFGFKQRTEVTGLDGGPIEVRSQTDLSKLTTAELKQLRELIGKAEVPLLTDGDVQDAEWEEKR